LELQAVKLKARGAQPPLTPICAQEAISAADITKGLLVAMAAEFGDPRFPGALLVFPT
jgi:hypothetical protein